MITLVVGIVCVAMGGISTYFIYQQQRDHRDALDVRSRIVRNDLRTKGMALSRNVALSSERAIAVMDFLFLAEVIATTVQNDAEMAYGIIMDQERRALVHSDPARANQILDGPADRFAAEQTVPTTQELNVGGEPVLEVVTPITVAGKRWGTLRFGLSLRALNEDIAKSERVAQEKMKRGLVSTLIAALLLMLVGSLLGAVFARRMTRPLATLMEGVHHIDEGRLDHQVRVQGSPEFVELADAFNAMTGRLGLLLEEMAGKQSLERELDLARDIQKNMSPTPDPKSLRHFDVAGRCDMAEMCGGDWWSYRELPDGRLLVVVGDVTGHGLPAAILAAAARGSLEAIAVLDETVLTPALVLDAIHQAIRDLGKDEMFMTGCAAILDPHQGVVDFANAGHLLPLAITPGPADVAPTIEVLGVRGNPLGSLSKNIGVTRQPLRPGTMLFFSTDGLNERLNSEGAQYGYRRVLRDVRELRSDGELSSAADLRDHLFGRVAEFAGAHPASDDITVVLCQWRKAAAAGVATGQQSATRG
jgi:serine phosphatase RsbU (regulator of sigma subunit)